MKSLSSYLELDEIRNLFKQIDALQAQVLLKTRLISNSGHATSEVEPVEISREATAKSATVLIQKILDLVRVAELKILQLPEKSVSEHFLQETLELYQAKIKHLRRKLKDSQLAAYSEENTSVHEQRLREYCPEKTGNDSDSERSVNARQALFAGKSTKKEGQNGNDKNKSIGQQILTQNKNITSSLQHSKQLMTMSVMQTELNIDTLDQQSKDLTQLNEKLIDMEAVLGKSKQIVKFIERQDKQDKRRIYAAIGFLLFCSAWVLWRRVLKMPVKILLWTLFKMFGIFNWASTITKRDNAPVELLLDVLASTVTHLESALSTTETIDIPQNEWEYKDQYSQQEFSPTTLVIDTDVGSTEPASTQIIEYTKPEINTEESADFADTLVQDIGEDQSVLTWEGSLPDMTEVTEPTQEESAPGADETLKHEESSFKVAEIHEFVNLNDQKVEVPVEQEPLDKLDVLVNPVDEESTPEIHHWENNAGDVPPSAELEPKSGETSSFSNEDRDEAHNEGQGEDLGESHGEAEIETKNETHDEGHDEGHSIYQAPLEDDYQKTTDQGTHSEVTFDSEPTNYTESIIERDFKVENIVENIDPIEGIQKEEPSSDIQNEQIENAGVQQEIRNEIPNDLPNILPNDPIQNEVVESEIEMPQQIQHEPIHTVGDKPEFQEEQTQRIEVEIPSHYEEQQDSLDEKTEIHHQHTQFPNENAPEQEQLPKENNIEEREITWKDVHHPEPIQDGSDIHDEL